MEPEEEIYVNVEQLSPTGGRCKHQEPQKTAAGDKAVGTDCVAEEETETWSHFKVATVCLGLLCFLLLTSVIPVAVLYDRDFNQLSRDLANHTAERNQLLIRNQNLTDERDRLESRLKRTATCPEGWMKFGCSCYLLSSTANIWSTSRGRCSREGADLVIIDSWEEMGFLNKLGANSKFWIGLSRTSGTDKWMWTDGRSPQTTFWQRGHPLRNPFRTQRCAAFNSFQAGILQLNVRSWSSEFCAQHLQWVCDKKAAPPALVN
ncbi:C-type lectin domain family 9 member A-like [Odontesthes bonariensis]